MDLEYHLLGEIDSGVILVVKIDTCEIGNVCDHYTPQSQKYVALAISKVLKLKEKR